MVDISYSPSPEKNNRFRISIKNGGIEIGRLWYEHLDDSSKFELQKSLYITAPNKNWGSGSNLGTKFNRFHSHWKIIHSFSMPLSLILKKKETSKKMRTENLGRYHPFYSVTQPSLDLIHPIFLGSKVGWTPSSPNPRYPWSRSSTSGGKTTEASFLYIVFNGMGGGEKDPEPGSFIHIYISSDVSLHIDTLFFQKKNVEVKSGPPLETKVIFQEPIFHFHDGRNIRFQYFSTVHSGDSRIMNHRTIGIWCKKTIQVVQADSVPCSPRSSPQTFLVSLVSLAFKFIRTGYQLLQGDWLHGFEVEPWILSRTMNHTEICTFMCKSISI